MKIKDRSQFGLFDSVIALAEIVGVIVLAVTLIGSGVLAMATALVVLLKLFGY